MLAATAAIAEHKEILFVPFPAVGEVADAGE
jgi:hypothetical protein